MFKFNLGIIAKDRVTGIEGKVIGRVEYLYAENAYLIRSKSDTGESNEEWLNEKQIEAAEEE